MLDGNYTRMLRAILNKSWQQHPTRHQLYGHLPPITKTIQIRRTRHAGHCWRSRDELIRDVLLWIPTHSQLYIYIIYIIYIYIYISQVESYQTLKKWYLMPCLALSIIWYVSRVKWSNSGNRVTPSLHLGVVVFEKDPSGHPRIRSSNLLTLYIYVYIYTWISYHNC